ncbi:MAG: hypothetical protein OQK78_13155 [Gammaproteobacteria bacterium]|nr:hypothetical protein [Gammaproteobacteria bacterium]
MNHRTVLILLTPLIFLGGCSSDEEQSAAKPSSNEHFLSDQVRAMEKAKEVEQMLQEGADQRQRTIEEYNR